MKKLNLLIGVLMLAGLAWVSCATTNHLPGDPAYSWLNGVWNGKGMNWEQTFEFKVVDNNKIVGWQESRNDELGQVGWGQMVGEINGDIIKVTVYKGTTTVYNIRKTLINQGIVLRKRT